MTIETERLRLELITRADQQDVFETMNDQQTAEIISFLSWPMTQAQAAWWCNKAEAGAASGDELLFLARHKERGAPVGCIGLHHITSGEGEVGYWVGGAWQRQGIVSEMLRGVINYGFGTMQLKKIWATTAYDNPASDGVLLKAGFVKAGEQDVVRPDGTVRKSQLFQLENILT